MSLVSGAVGAGGRELEAVVGWCCQGVAGIGLAQCIVPL